jgi:hypothetical protein
MLISRLRVWGVVLRGMVILAEPEAIIVPLCLLNHFMI